MKKYTLPQVDQHIETVILANGEFPKSKLSLSILRNANYIVCCDGAINNLANTDIMPNAIVGDCDSLSMKQQEQYKDIIHRFKEQETNDLTKAVNFCVERGRKDITILGATGKREDHTIGNISLLCRYMSYANVQMITDYGIFVPIQSDSVFESFPKQQVSLFCIDKSLITTHKLFYAVENRRFDSWWEATLNESIADEFGVDTDGRTIVYRLF